jgi:hypothetical protein
MRHFCMHWLLTDAVSHEIFLILLAVVFDAGMLLVMLLHTHALFLQKMQPSWLNCLVYYFCDATVT